MIYLASSSPRRAELLQQIGVPFHQLVREIDESPLTGEPPKDYVLRMAREKAQASWQQLLACKAQKYPLLAADTTVAFNQKIVGKPADDEDARHMLATLSGNTHQVLTAVTMTNGEQQQSCCTLTEVTFNSLSDQLISDYIASGEHKDKAGAYGIQGYGAVLVAHIKGSYSGVVGLPLMETAQLLTWFQIPFWQVAY